MAQYAAFWTDEHLREAWLVCRDIAVNDDDSLDEDLIFMERTIASKGSDKYDVWHWFDEMYSGGLDHLMRDVREK